MLREIKKLLKKYKIFAKNSLGQHFLIDKKISNLILKTGEISLKDIVIEIGPGLGVLTKKLAQKAKKVIAIEKDEKLAKILNEKILNNKKNVKIIKGDILKFPFSKFERFKNYKVVANLPYSIATLTIRKFLEAKKKPELMAVLIQKEVAKKICQKVPKMNLLALTFQLYSEPKIIKIIKKDCFFPKPKVEGAILKIKPKKIENLNLKKFFKILKAGFSHPRKKIKNNLKLIFGKNVEKILKSKKINPNSRPQELEIKDWKKLSKNENFF